MPKALFVGLAAVDLIYSVDDVPARNQKLSVPGQSVCAGGPATNAAVTFAYLGGRAELVSATGSHPMASVIRDDLARHSVKLHELASRRREPPPVSSIMVMRGTGDRSVVSANAAVFSQLKIGFNAQWLRGVSILMVDGQYMQICTDAARLAREREIPVVMDGGSWKPGMQKLLPFVDIAICSDDYRPPGCRNVADVFDYLGRKNIRRIAITSGPSPLRFQEHGATARIDIEKIHAKDTLGAGDIFHGAFCYYFLRPGASFSDALAKAAKVATFSCLHPGTRQWMEKRGASG